MGLLATTVDHPHACLLSCELNPQPSPTYPPPLACQVARLFLDDGALIVRTEGKARSSATPITAPGPAATSGACAWMWWMWHTAAAGDCSMH